MPTQQPRATSDAPDVTPSFLGHPPGLFVLFFAEMWERFSYYGMRALLLFYMLKGFLAYRDPQAYAVYGSYTALVYMTPFFGGRLADHVLGQRRAVVLGGLLMAAGHLLMTVQNVYAFYCALALLICGNGFFKPNISTQVGSLYPAGDKRRDAAFIIFYMGVNLGAALAPLLCGYIGQTYGWHYGFGLATIGMLSGLAVFVAPNRVTQIMIGLTALAAAVALVVFRPEDPFSIAANLLIGIALVVSGVLAWKALDRGGLPGWSGAPRHPERLQRRVLGRLTLEWTIYASMILAVPFFALLVSGFAPFTPNGLGVTLVPPALVEGLQQSSSAGLRILAVVMEEVSRPAGLLLLVAGLGAVAWVVAQSLRLDRVPRQRMYVVMVLTFFSMLFWAFFEQAGSSLNNFADRNVARVTARERVTPDMVGRTLRLQPTQEQLGYHNGERMFAMDQLDSLRSAHEATPAFEIDWTIAPDNVGMGIARRADENPASVYQAVNPVFILAFGLLFTLLWTFLGTRDREPSTPFKFALGLLQLGLGFAALWWGAQHADLRGMVGLQWLIVGYLLHTTGELCLSPVGLAMVTKLSPLRLRSTTMGMWFLATAFSQYLAAIISQFTKGDGSGSGSTLIPIPRDSVHVYGGVFGNIALAAAISAAVCFMLVPLLKRWMHEGVQGEED